MDKPRNLAKSVTVDKPSPMKQRIRALAGRQSRVARDTTDGADDDPSYSRPGPGHDLQPRDRLWPRRPRHRQRPAGVRADPARPGTSSTTRRRSGRRSWPSPARHWIRPGSGRRGRGRHGHHQPARDDHPLGQDHRAARRQRHRLAEPGQCRDLRPTESRRAWSPPSERRRGWWSTPTSPARRSSICWIDTKGSASGPRGARSCSAPSTRC